MPTNTMTPGAGFDLDNPNQQDKQDGPVECLGKTFANNAERREHYLVLLAEKLKDPEFRETEGFPLGEDEDILELSDPPYYTACPNPFVEDFIAHYGRPYDPAEGYKREPYAADVSEGKSDPIYNAHSYHTKVPHKAIMRYILHYTNPGDVVFDGFCGSGMTGVAAQLCNDKSTIESLGYKVLADGSVLAQGQEDDSGWDKVSSVGPRMAVMSDLSPAATFVASNYNSPKNDSDFHQACRKSYASAESEFGWMYQTAHEFSEEAISKATALVGSECVSSLNALGIVGRVNYTIFSEVLLCPECASDFVFWDVAVDRVNGKVLDRFSCPSCQAEITKRNSDKARFKFYDEGISETIEQVKYVPVLINYSVGSKRFEKIPDALDQKIISFSDDNPSPYWYPTSRLIDGKETRRNDPVGITHTHHFYTNRSLNVLSKLLDGGYETWAPFNALTPRATKMHRIAASRLGGKKKGEGGATVGVLSGTLYVPSISVEMNVLSQAADRIKAYEKFSYQRSESVLSTQSTTTMSGIPDGVVDYIFIDPPFGANINYSELSSLWESWLKVMTNSSEEAIENSAQNKGANEYRQLMARCFSEAYRVLKPGHWMTVEFSNTKASVWNSIQVALTDAGFIVADVSALDKKQGSFKAVTTPTAVKQDLVISAYKPNGGFEQRFSSESDDDGVWDFVRTHLGYLPIVKKQRDELVKIPERDPRILFDQVVAYFVRSMKDVPVSSKEFQEGLSERFSERDGMVFLPEQVAEYDKSRMTSTQLKQMSIFVDDEASAIEWLRQFLDSKPQTYQEIHPKFLNELNGWKKAEEQLELSKLLSQSFLVYSGDGPLPSQVHSYLSSNFKEMRNLAKDDQQLIRKAKDRWYVPNPEREEDLQKLRDRDLLKQFDEYKEHAGRKLKTVRMEAVRSGFKKAWQEQDYKTIINVAEKIPQNLLQEDQKLLMWYDQAQTRDSGESLF